MQIETVDIAAVIPYDNNPRHNEDAVALVRDSLVQYGWRQPIVVDKDMVVIVGHTRLLAARKLGMTSVPVHVAENLTDAQAKAYRLADNRTGETATWDLDLLKLELDDLGEAGFPLDMTGFNDAEIARAMTIDMEDLSVEDEWQGMPEFDPGDKRAYRTLIVHFHHQQAVDDFLEKTGKQVNDTTRAIWFPEIEIDRVIDKQYAAADEEENIEYGFDLIESLKYPIYIPSKGRARTCNTPHLLIDDAQPFYIVVEPQDRNSYVQEFGPDYVLTMEENDRGIAYARNYCKDHSISQGDPYHWQIDDDLKNFLFRSDSKNTACAPREVLCPVEDYVDSYGNVGMAGLKHSLFAWSAKKEIEFNKQVCTCGLFNNSVDAKWRDGVIEDTDYSMQVLSLGWCSVLFNRLLYDPPPASTNSGGNNASGHYDKYLSLLEGLQARWKADDGSDLFSIVEKKGEPRLKSNRVWMRFKQQPE
jgi:ParB-like chromosome segregation protein Spo0J